MFNFNHKRNKDSNKDRLKYPNTDKFPWYSSKHAQNLHDALTRESDDYSYPWHDRQASQESKPSEDSSPWYANTHVQDLDYFSPISPKSTKPEKLMTPQDYAVYVEPNLQYQPILSKQQQDAVLADFTAWFNDYLKKSVRRITRNTKAICIPARYISEDYIYYDKDNEKYHLLDFIADYLSNHGWEFELKSYGYVDNTRIIRASLKLRFNYEKYAKQAKDDK